jgi:hypothetical protein
VRSILKGVLVVRMRGGVYIRLVVPTRTPGAQMNFGRAASIVIAIVAVLAVFIEIPFVSDYAFWALVVALFIWFVSHDTNKTRFKLELVATFALLTVAIVGVFVEIPIVSDYAFWIVAAAYLITAGATQLHATK